MNQFRFRHLNKFKVGGTGSQLKLSVPAPLSPTGKIYRECPDTSCSPRLFQLGKSIDGARMTESHRSVVAREPGTDGTTCPYCGRAAADRDFIAGMDIEAIKERVAYEVQRDVEDWMKGLARDFNRRVSGAPLSVSMKVASRPRPKPLAIREDLLRDVTCSVCSRNYAVYAIGLFCPDCGAAQLAEHYAREIDLVRRQLDLVAHKQDADRELGYRLLGNAHEDVLTAFEATQKTVYRYLLRTRVPSRFEELCGRKTIRNAFQNVDRSRSLFSELGVDAHSSLSHEELQTLELNIQKRHVIGHNLSVIDDRYQALAADGQPGQTISLLREDVERFASITAAIVTKLHEQLPSPAAH